MTPRTRTLTWGSAAVLTVAGIVCAFAVNGTLGEALAIGLLSVGVGGALLLVFAEIGFGEERDLAREQRAREAEQRRSEREAERGRQKRRRALRPRRRS